MCFTAKLTPQRHSKLTSEASWAALPTAEEEEEAADDAVLRDAGAFIDVGRALPAKHLKVSRCKDLNHSDPSKV